MWFDESNKELMENSFGNSSKPAFPEQTFYSEENFQNEFSEEPKETGFSAIGEIEESIFGEMGDAVKGALKLHGTDTAIGALVGTGIGTAIAHTKSKKSGKTGKDRKRALIKGALIGGGTGAVASGIGSHLAVRYVNHKINKLSGSPGLPKIGIKSLYVGAKDHPKLTSAYLAAWRARKL